ncbi:hypothetical protein EVU96_25225 [Bacillus infantis]|uniref:hypothetical protein n=1 Tax=Bacillus infantis TaxID=324767 RepID=UPI00101DEAC0|nr:hypothetical protein [Bacillus infantis]RYI24990.1 hypothetical protein EVU96_25225 [Bacillus infantis]
MKKLLALPILSILLLTACGGSDETSNQAENKVEPKAAEQKEVSNKPAEPEVKDNGSIVFTEAGQKGDVETGTLELLKIKTVNETVSIAPMQVTIKDIKVFKLTNMTDEYKTEMEAFNDNQPIGDSVNYIQVSYTGENTEDKNIGWNSLLNAVTDKGEQIDVQLNDMIYTDADLANEYLGKVKKEYTDGFIIKDADISKIKFVWGSSFDTDTYMDITEEQQVEYTF